MSVQATSIEWTDMTVNPIRARRVDGSNRVDGHYCEKVSAACAFCYASDRWQPRFGMPKFPGAPKLDTLPVMDERGFVRVKDVEVYLDRDRLKVLATSKKISGRKVFICDMTDMFGSWVPDQWLHEIFSVMEQRSDVTWQVLTKRADRMADYLSWRWGDSDGERRIASRNIWAGVTIEQACEAWRIFKLLRCPARVKFVSAEPLLGHLDIDWKSAAGRGLSWVITGGETGSQRPTQLDHVRSIRDGCTVAGVPFFFKQWGDWIPGKFDTRKSKMVCEPAVLGETVGRIFWTNPGHPPLKLHQAIDHYWTGASARVGKKAAGRILDGRTWDEFPTVAREAVTA